VKADWGGQDLPFRIQKINNHPVEEDAADIIHKEVRKENIELKTLNSTSVNTLTQNFLYDHRREQRWQALCTNAYLVSFRALWKLQNYFLVSLEDSVIK
jgi:hypothetical protein